MTTPAPRLRASARRVVRRCISATMTGDGMRRRTGGQEPSTRHPLLRALARRVDWVLMATSPLVNGHPAPTPTVLLCSEVGFSLHSTCCLPIQGGQLYLFCMTSL